MVRILITSHGTMAEGMAQSVRMLVGEQDHLDIVTFEEEMGAEELEERFRSVLGETSDDHQYLVFCDILGGTPFNVVSRFSYQNDNIAVIYGMNLPLVIEALMISGDGEVCLQQLAKDLMSKAGSSIGLSTL